MHAIVNHFPIRSGSNWDELAAKVSAFVDEVAKPVEAIKSIQLVKASDTEAIFVVVFKDLAALQVFSSNVAGPWFGEHIRPYLSGPASRSVGEVIAGFA